MSHLFNFTGVTANKAGMGADKRLVADFVYERSRGSQYTQHQLDLDAKQRSRTEALTAELLAAEGRMTPLERAAEVRRASERLAALEARRRLSRTYCVVDMDMFYAAVELRDRPELASRPVAVGGLGMITTANYVARLYGVRAAMPGFIALEMVKQPHLVGSKMPPDELVFIKPDFGKYASAASEAREIFRQYDPAMQAHTLDEAYLDLTEALAARGGAVGAEALVQELRSKVKERTGGLTCSAGIGPSPMLAKIASDEKKPDGQFAIGPGAEDVLRYMAELPLRKIPGCGKVLEHQLAVMLKAQTCGELLRAAPRLLRAFAARPKTCDFLLRACLGLSGDEVGDDSGEEVGQVGRKSLSMERTFTAEGNSDELRARLQDLCRHLAEQMAASVPPLAARCASLKLKTTAFVVRCRQVTSPKFVGFEADFGQREAAPGAPAAREGPAEAESRPEGGAEVGDKAAVGGCKEVLGPPDGPGRGAGEHLANEAAVARVAGELYGLLSPVLEEQLPCTLRLMGVRVSSFRGERKVLQKGQQQLANFFGGARDPAAGREVPLTDAATAAVVEEDIDSSGEDVGDLGGSGAVGGRPEGGSAAAPPRPEDVEVVTVLDADDVDTTAQATEPGLGSTEPQRGMVACPVCQMLVPLDQADRHVNDHYDRPSAPSPLLVSMMQKASTAGADRSLGRRKRGGPAGSVVQVPHLEARGMAGAHKRRCA